MKNLKDEIECLINNYPRNYCQILQSSKDCYKELSKRIILSTKFLPEEFSMQTRIFYILEDLTDIPKCEICGKRIMLEATKKNGFGVRNRDNTFAYICKDKKCRLIHKKKQMEETFLKKYGVTNPNKLSETREKIRKTTLKKYGVEHYTQTPEYKEKVLNISLKKYGVSHYASSKTVKDNRLHNNLTKYGVGNVFQTETAKEKIKKTVKEKYGTDNVSQAEIIKNKKSATCLEKYGVSSPFASKEIQERIKEKMISAYGVDNPFKADLIKEKIKGILMEKYRVDYPGKTEKSRLAVSLRNTRIAYEKLLESQDDIPLFSFEEFHKHDRMKNLKFKCKKCGYEFESKHYDGSHRKCPICFPLVKKEQSYSKQEKEITDFIKSVYSGNDVIENDRTVLGGNELDIYIPSKKLAIEYDGLYWHSDCNKDKFYHLRKTEECLQKGDIQLIHIFENEWINPSKREIVKSRLKNCLGVYDFTCYARQCEIREVSPDESLKFQDNNHLQGSVNSKVNLGLYYENELVSLMTFSRSRFDRKSKHEYELVRFCNKLNWHIPGSASRLLHYFKEKYQPKNIITYADRRWSKGNLYEKLGFTLDHISAPNYWYWKRDNVNGEQIVLESRVKYQKHKLPDILSHYNPEKTEIENMVDNGYNRIFDCGNLVYKLTIA